MFSRRINTEEVRMEEQKEITQETVEDKKKERLAFVMELLVAVFLGITAVLTAYASWQSALYGGVQAEKYTMSTSMIAEANSLYNEGTQLLAQDMDVWNKISDLRVELYAAETNGDAVAMETIQYKIDTAMYNNVSEELSAAIEWADAQELYASPFEMEGFVDSYYEVANAKYAEGEQSMKEGSEANTLGDKQGLVTVIYSVVLFLLGIVGTFKNTKIRMIVTVLSVVTLAIGAGFMLTIPMLTV